MTDKKQSSVEGADETPAVSSEQSRQARLAKQDILFFFVKLAFVAAAAWVLLGVVFGAAVMRGEDMYPRIRDGDLMIYYRLQKDYHIGDVAVFSKDGQQYTGRIVAMGGDTVDISSAGELLVNGNVQSEEIFYPTEKLGDAVAFPFQVPQGSVFLLCDFRTNAADSRAYGAVQTDDLSGKVISILRRRGI